MRHFVSAKFLGCRESLPEPVQKLADKNFQLLKTNPRHPSLRFKKIGPYGSLRIGLGYRALAVEIPEGFLWFWIGSHSDYERLIG